MHGTDQQTILNASFNRVDMMRSGKLWPKALRGFRMVTTVLLEATVSTGNTDVAALTHVLPGARDHSSGCLQIDCFIAPVFIAHLFICAE